jgi:hypothetical protein
MSALIKTQFILESFFTLKKAAHSLASQQISSCSWYEEIARHLDFMVDLPSNGLPSIFSLMRASASSLSVVAPVLESQRSLSALGWKR